MSISSKFPRKFKVALVIADKTAEKFAHENGVTQGAISLIINGKGSSKRLMEEMEALIMEHVPPVLLNAIDAEK